MTTRALILASLMTLPACAGSAGNTNDDDGAALTDGKADGAAGDGWFVMRPDLRRCAAPACGGAFVKRVNYATTRCADGTRAAECYVAAVDYSIAKLDDNDVNAIAGQLVVVKASFTSRQYPTGSFPVLAVSDVWAGVVGTRDAASYPAFDGTVYRVKDNGIRCITTPCPSEHEWKLNGSSSRDIAGVDFSSVGASDQQISDANAAMRVGDGVPVAGFNNIVCGTGGTFYELAATNFFARVTHKSDGGGQPQACGGIAGLTCSDPSQWCDPTPNDACGGADLLGVCTDTDVVCAQVYQPVCGCDGTTYSNDCERVRAKMQKAHDGACAVAS